MASQCPLPQQLPRHAPTVFRKEQSIDSTTCLSGQVAIYVMALTPFVGRTSDNVSSILALLEEAYWLAYTWIYSTE